MALSAEELSSLCGVQGISVKRQGEYDFPAGTPIESKVKAVVAIFDSHSKESEHSYFAIGHIVNSIESPAYGERSRFCRKHFGANRGKLAMEFSWVAKYWSWKQDVGWAWGFYKASARAGRKMQEEYIRRWQRGQLTVRQVEADTQARKKAQGYDGSRSTWNDSTTDSTQSSDTQYNVESVDLGLTADLSRKCVDLFAYETDSEGAERERKVGTIGTKDLPAFAELAIKVGTQKERKHYQCLLIEADEEERGLA